MAGWGDDPVLEIAMKLTDPIASPEPIPITTPDQITRSLSMSRVKRL